MDPELKAYLDERFRENRAEMLGLRGEVNGLRSDVGGFRGEMNDLRSGVGGLRGEMNDLRSGVGGLRGEMNDLRGDVGGLRGEMNDLRGDVGGLRGEMSDFRGEVGSLRDESHQTRIVVEDLRGQVRLLAEGVMGVTEKLEEHRTEVRLGFENVKASIVPYYQNLDERIGLLEARADRQTRDVLDVIREKYGKR